MCLLLETIKINNNQIFNIDYHNNRFNNSRKVFFGLDENIDLRNYIKSDNKNGLLKCRIVYSEKIEEVTYSQYTIRKINTLKIVHSTDISYDFKFFDRSNIIDLYNKKEYCDDILIIKNGYVTDTSFSNVVFFDGNKFFTPANPLLNGTKRQKLIEELKITEDEIRLSCINRFKKLFLINSMFDIEDNVSIEINDVCN